MVRDPRDFPPYALTAHPWVRRISPRMIGFIVLGAGLVYTGSTMLPTPPHRMIADYLTGNSFPKTGEFRVRPEQASSPTGTLSIGAGDQDVVVQLHDSSMAPVFIGFVRAGDTAKLPVPAGTWRPLIFAAREWAGVPTLINAEQFAKLGTLEIKTGQDLSVTPAPITRDQTP